MTIEHTAPRRAAARRALVVDQNPGERHAIATLLQQAGYQVTIARNGVEALERFATEIPEVLLTEIVLPEKDGLEVIEQVRKLYPATTILAVSGSPRAHGYLSAARLLGANHTLYKPLSADRLHEALRASGERPIEQP